MEPIVSTQLTGEDGEPLNEYVVTVKVRVRDYSTADAIIGMMDTLSDAAWVVGEPEISAVYDGPAYGYPRAEPKP
jgi:hypothetical protein